MSEERSPCGFDQGKRKAARLRRRALQEKSKKAA